MPPRWFHEGFDIVAFGRSYWRLHQRKDSPWRELGPDHRAVDHEWYPLFEALEALAPFPESVLAMTRRIRDAEGPEAAEEFQVRVCHDYLDRWWDDLPGAERIAVASILREVLLDPPLLLRWADVDVIRGLVKVTYGQEHGYHAPVERWENEPSLPEDYRNLRAYLELRSIDELLYSATESDTR